MFAFIDEGVRAADAPVPPEQQENAAQAAEERANQLHQQAQEAAVGQSQALEADRLIDVNEKLPDTRNSDGTEWVTTVYYDSGEFNLEPGWAAEPVQYSYALPEIRGGSADTARINGIKVVLDKIKQFGGLPSIIMGDFNADEKSSTYKAATKHFLDAKYQTENTMTGATYQGFGRQLERENIDYFMISKSGIKVNEYKIVNNTYDGVYPSDHFSIVIKIELT